MNQQHILFVREDGVISASGWIDNPNNGPTTPVFSSCPGETIVAFDGEFTRVGRRDTEVAYLRNGAVEWEDHSVLDDEKTAAIDAIDAAGEALRLSVINRMTTQTEEYRRVEVQARAWRDAGYLENDEAPAPRGVRSWAAAKWREGWTNRQACDDILATADGWYSILDTIRDLRLMNKEDVRHAAAAGEIAAIVADMEADVRSMAAQLQLTLTT